MNPSRRPEDAPESLWRLEAPSRLSFVGSGFLGLVWLQDAGEVVDGSYAPMETWCASVSYPIPGSTSRGFAKLKSLRGGDFITAREAQYAVEHWKRVDDGSAPLVRHPIFVDKNGVHHEVDATTTRAVLDSWNIGGR